MTSGQLVVFEGKDGVGKSTLSQTLLAEIQNRGNGCRCFSFPGREPGTLGKLIYDVHHNSRRFEVDSMTNTSLQLLHVAAHIDAIETQIAPAIFAGQYIILDRYWWSTLAYGIACGANRESLDLMIQIERNHWRDVVPKVVFYVEREVGVNDDAQKALSDEYENIIRREREHQKIVRIANNSTIQDGLSAVLNFIDATP